MNKTLFSDKLDLFAASPDPMNINGRKRIHTCPGLFCTGFLVIMTLSFLSFRVCEIFLDETPIIVSAEKTGVWDDPVNNFVDVGENKDFMLAFAVRDLTTDVYKSERGYINWEIHIHRFSDYRTRVF